MAAAALAFAQEGQAPPAAKQETPAAASSAYAGSETCAACHEDIAKAFSRNRHAVVKDRKVGGETERACEACHGPGAKHAESTEAAQIVKPVKSDTACLGCHRGSASHNWRAVSGHARAGVNCANCHSIHAPEPAAEVSHAAAVNQKCGSCHPAALAAFQRPHAHRLRQGAMSCVDCHAPHGGPFTPSLSTTAAQERACLKCHGEKRGPFTFEHAPVRLEGCSACHEPHGSNNPRMLTRSEPNRLCLECHASLGALSGKAELGGVPPAFHDLRSSRYRNCTVCHTRVHGSNVNRSLLR